MAEEPQEEGLAVELLTPAQICTRLQISREMLRRLTDRHKIPVRRLGPRSLRYDPTDVLNAIDNMNATGNTGTVYEDKRRAQ